MTPRGRTLAEFQAHIAELYLEKDKRRGAEGTLLWLIEEVGELTEAARRIRSEPSERGRTRAPEAAGAAEAASAADVLADEIADCLAWTASLANLHGVDLEAAVARKYPATCARCGEKPCACAETSVARL